MSHWQQFVCLFLVQICLTTQIHEFIFNRIFFTIAAYGPQIMTTMLKAMSCLDGTNASSGLLLLILRQNIFQPGDAAVPQ